MNGETTDTDGGSSESLIVENATVLGKEGTIREDLSRGVAVRPDDVKFLINQDINNQKLPVDIRNKIKEYKNIEGDAGLIRYCAMQYNLITDKEPQEAFALLNELRGWNRTVVGILKQRRVK